MVKSFLSAVRKIVLGTLVLGIFAMLWVASGTPVNAAEGINQRINFQGRLLTQQGAAASDGYYNIEFKIYQDGDGQTAGNTTGSPAGALKWTEDWLNSGGHGVQVRNGYFSVELGTVNAFGSQIDWNQDTLFLSINIGDKTSCTITTGFTTDCGGDGEMLPMKRLSSTPYALNAGMLGGRTAAGFIQNSTTPQSANIAIQSADAGDVAVVIQGAVSQTGDLLQLQDSDGVTLAKFDASGNLTVPSVYATTLDTATATALNIGTANATAINLNQDTVVAAGKSLKITGSGTRPVSPTAGMVYYDTTTNQLLTYNGTKWMSDQKTTTKIVAASNSSQAVKDSADYVADGTADQTEINSALTAAAGGKVYLAEGTYTINANISIPNNTTLAGSGQNTLITIPNGFDTGINAITNTTTGGNGTGITIRDLRLDGNKANQTAGSMYGIYLNGAGSGTGASAVQGARITNVQSNNWRFHGFYLNNSANNTLSNNTAQANSSYGFRLNGSTNNVLTNNTSQGNTTEGFYVQASSNANTFSGNTAQGNSGHGYSMNASTNNTFTGNTAQGNTDSGFYLNAGTNNTITGNSASGNSSSGIRLMNGANNNTVSGNTFSDNGNTTNNNSIYIDASDSNTITGNTITDTSATSNNYAINILNNTSDTNYLADNRFSSTPGTSTINDVGTGTVYANQPRAENGGQLTVRTANDAAAFSVQNASGTSILNIDTSNTKVLVGGAIDTTTATTLSVGTSTATAIILGKAGITTTNAGALTVSQLLTGNLGATISGAAISLNASSNFDTSINTGTSTGAVNIGNASAGAITLNSATAINLNQDTVIAADKSLKITGSGTRPGSPTAGMVYYDTTTNQLLTYNGTKWMSDQKTATKIVAASDSSQAIKDSADYVANGTDDQVQINAALTAAAGGKVYLAEGTYVLHQTNNGDATIFIPNNTTLAGAGQGTVIEMGDIDAVDNMIENTDTANGTGVTIRDLKVDGRKDLNTVGTQHGIYMANLGTGNGDSSVRGGTFTNLWVGRMQNGSGFRFNNVDHSVITNNFVFDINASTGIYLSNGNYNTVTGNDVHGNGLNGITLTNTSTYNTVSNNISRSNDAYGIGISATSSDNTITGNTVSMNGNRGISIASSNNNVVTGNSVDSNGANTTNEGIYISDSDNTVISSNRITDTNCTTTCHAIDIADAISDKTYIADNMLTGGSATYPATINDAGTGTIYANQSTTAAQTLQSSSSIIKASASSVITGSIDPDGTTTVTGSGTFFVSQLQVGDRITVSGETRTIVSITDDDTLTISSAFSDNANDVSVDRLPAALIVRNSAGVNVLDVSDIGAVRIKTSTNTSVGFQVQGSTGTDVLTVSTSTNGVYVNGLLDTTGAATLNIGTGVATGVTIGRAGQATILQGSSVALNTDTISSNQATVALLNTGVTTINAFGAATTLNIGADTGTTTINNSVIFGNSTTDLITFNGIIQGGNPLVFEGSGADANELTLQVTNPTEDRIIILPDESGTVCLQNSANCGFLAGTAADYIQNQSAGQQATSNFWLSGTGRADTSITTPLLDTATATALAIGTTNATSIALNQDTVIAADKSLKITGSGTRPGSPTAGMVYYDTSTNQLLTYNGTKWMSDQKTATKIVAASDSSQAIKDSADYVADGTDDQVQINDALTAAAGGMVYLADGTYTTHQTDDGDATILVPNDTTLAGAGRGTIIMLGNIGANTDNLIENEDKTTGTNVVIRDLMLNGQKTVNTGTQDGIYFNNMGSGSGSSAVQGGVIENVLVKEFRRYGIYSYNSDNTKLLNNTVKSSNGYGVSVHASDFVSVVGNHSQGNGSTGIRLTSTTRSIVSNNILESNGQTGLYIESSEYNTINGNTITSSSGAGFRINDGDYNNVSNNNIRQNLSWGVYINGTAGNHANSNIVANNTIYDSGFTTNNNGIYLSYADNSAITGNHISDTAATTNYAINIVEADSTSNYLANNVITSGTVNDNGTGTIYGGQSDGTTYRIQPASNTTIGSASTTTTVQGSAVITGSLTSSGGNISLNNSSNYTVNIGTGTSTGAVSIGNSANTTTLGSNTINVGSATAATTIQKTTQTTSDTSGAQLTLLGATGNGTGAGGIVTIQGGTGGATNANGGFVYINGGVGTGTGVQGLVVTSTQAYSTVTDSTCGTNCTITQARIDAYGAVIVEATATSLTVTLPDPTITTAGRVVYITAANGSEDFTLSVNGGGQGNEIAMRENTTATMIWNGSDWTAAGASSSTTLQAAYDNTLTAAGGAEIILNNTASSNGLTVRNSASNPISGAIFEAQTSIGSNLFSVNNNATEYATNGGAETVGASSSTFPANTWSAAPAGGTVSRYTTAGDYVSTGQASVSVVTGATANHGAMNKLSTTLTPNLRYKVSYAVRATASFSTLNTSFSNDGTTTSLTACKTGSKVTQGLWTRVQCTFDAPASGITSSNSLLIHQSDATARTFYLENLSVTISADVNHAVDGDVDDPGSFTTNYTAAPAGGTVSRSLTTLYNTSGSAQTVTAATANQGIRNNLKIDLKTSTQYLVSFYALSSNAFSDITVGYSRDGGTSTIPCTDYNTQTVSSSTWTKITCVFTTDSTTATNADLLIRQGSATARTFWVDSILVNLNTNTASNVQIGGGNYGGPTTLLTLDRSDGAPIAANNPDYYGSMYYDTTTGRIQCYEADGWGACGSPPDNYVNLNPEYAGAVLNGGGIGTMNADLCANETGVLSVNAALCSSGESKNFYSWTSPQASQQTYSIYVSYQLPSTFKGFNSDDTVELTARVDSTTNAAVTYEMFRSENGSLVQCGTSETSVTTSADTWQTVGINGNEATGCGFTSQSAEAYVIFKINMKANSNANAYVSTLSFVTTGQ